MLATVATGINHIRQAPRSPVTPNVGRIEGGADTSRRRCCEAGKRRRRGKTTGHLHRLLARAASAARAQWRREDVAGRPQHRRDGGAPRLARLVAVTQRRSVVVPQLEPAATALAGRQPADAVGERARQHVAKSNRLVERDLSGGGERGERQPERQSARSQHHHDQKGKK